MAVLAGAAHATATTAAPTTPTAPAATAATATAATAAPAAAGAQALAPTSVLELKAGTSRLVALDQPIERVSVAQPGVVDVMVTGPRELYLLARGLGTTNLLLWSRGAPVAEWTVQVEMDTGPLQRQLARLLPDERDLQVQAVADSVALTGTVANVLRAEQAVALAQGHVRALARLAVPAAALGMASSSMHGPTQGSTPGATPGAGPGARPHVINLLTIRQPQQVMLEVKVAEVSRNLLDQFGVSLNLSRTAGSMTYGLVTQALQDAFGRLTVSGRHGSATVDAKAQDALVRILAEPNIVALSGQEGSFLAGGKVFIPVARDTAEGRATITLEEKEYGVGLRFTPQVLDGDVVQLRVAPEVSELTKTGSPFLTTGSATTVLPSFTTRRASTTVQLRDGQSLAIAGLIKNNLTESVSRFPFLADIPILGALFRSTEFQTDRSELLFVITPRLIKALPGTAPLPTDQVQPPDRIGGLLGGRLEAQDLGVRDAPVEPQPE